VGADKDVLALVRGSHPESHSSGQTPVIDSIMLARWATYWVNQSTVCWKIVRRRGLLWLTRTPYPIRRIGRVLSVLDNPVI